MQPVENSSSNIKRKYTFERNFKHSDSSDKPSKLVGNNIIFDQVRSKLYNPIPKRTKPAENFINNDIIKLDSINKEIIPNKEKNPSYTQDRVIRSIKKENEDLKIVRCNIN
jgi:hypothetical protein